MRSKSQILSKLRADGHITDEEYKVLKQEPKTDTLDKISAEIADIYCGQYCENPLTADAVREMVLEIIDKYKAESRDKE